MTAAPVYATMVHQPNNTLYVSNIDWKIKKPLLRRALYSLFTRHGKVLEIIALRKEGLRGQAFVIFEDVQAATAALQSENGFNFFGKELKINYAKEKSDRIAKRDGTYVPKARRKKTAAPKPPPPSAAPGEAPPQPPPPTSGKKETSDPPSHILFAENLPEEVSKVMLEMLFRQYSGFKEVRVPRPGLAFIEFDEEPHATLALKGLNGFKLTTKDSLSLKYGKS